MCQSLRYWVLTVSSLISLTLPLELTSQVASASPGCRNKQIPYYAQVAGADNVEEVVWSSFPSDSDLKCSSNTLTSTNKDYVNSMAQAIDACSKVFTRLRDMAHDQGIPKNGGKSCWTPNSVDHVYGTKMQNSACQHCVESSTCSTADCLACPKADGATTSAGNFIMIHTSDIDSPADSGLQFDCWIQARSLFGKTVFRGSMKYKTCLINPITQY